MQCILYKIYFWKVFHVYYNLICILYALVCGQNFIFVKSGCYRWTWRCMCVVEVEEECIAEAVKMSTLVMGISNALVDLKMLPIQDIPQPPKIAQEILTVLGLILSYPRSKRDEPKLPCVCPGCSNHMYGQQ
jgi:hypothetical protein